MVLVVLCKDMHVVAVIRACLVTSRDMCRIKEVLTFVEPTKKTHRLHGIGQTGDATPVVGDKDSCAPHSGLVDSFVL